MKTQSTPDKWTANLHLVKPCNMKCGFCFAHFHDATTKLHLPQTELLRLIDELYAHGCRKFTFVGGEPLMCRFLPELIGHAKSLGPDVITMVVTNGTLLLVPPKGRTHPTSMLELMSKDLDWLTISVDSIDPQTNTRIGRRVNGAQAPDLEYYVNLFRKAEAAGIQFFKINTVVNALNWTEDLSPLIEAVKPDRWKLFQVLRLVGENEEAFDRFAIGLDQFMDFVDRHQASVGRLTTIKPEANDDMEDSYCIIDPDGCFVGNSNQIKSKSRPILEVGFETAFSEVNFNENKFRKRGGADYFNPQDCAG